MQNSGKYMYRVSCGFYMLIFNKKISFLGNKTKQKQTLM